tara:strand:- start:24 stop:413 length:390 start_codon:yes stop_codon:yes gene_type:complete
MKGQVQVYRNLSKKLHEGDHGPVYSVRGEDGLIKKHTCHLVLRNCVFRVSDKGNKRVRDEKRKNVHAYVQGVDCHNQINCTWILDSVAITYDPYKYKTFVRKDTGKPVHKAEWVVFGCGEKGREVRAIL